MALGRVNVGGGGFQEGETIYVSGKTAVYFKRAGEVKHTPPNIKNLSSFNDVKMTRYLKNGVVRLVNYDANSKTIYTEDYSNSTQYIAKKTFSNVQGIVGIDMGLGVIVASEGSSGSGLNADTRVVFFNADINDSTARFSVNSGYIQKIIPNGQNIILRTEMMYRVYSPAGSLIKSEISQPPEGFDPSFFEMLVYNIKDNSFLINGRTYDGKFWTAKFNGYQEVVYKYADSFSVLAADVENDILVTGKSNGQYNFEYQIKKLSNGEILSRTSGLEPYFILQNGVFFTGDMRNGKLNYSLYYKDGDYINEARGYSNATVPCFGMSDFYPQYVAVKKPYIYNFWSATGFYDLRNTLIWFE